MHGLYDMWLGHMIHARTKEDMISRGAVLVLMSWGRMYPNAYNYF